MSSNSDTPDDYQVPSPPTDLEAHERELREASGFKSPREAARRSRGTETSPRSCAVLRRDVPSHRRTPPHGFTLTDGFEEHPIPRGSVICGPVTSRHQAKEHLTDGVGWLIRVGPDGTREPVPIVTGQHYDGSPRLAILAEMLVPPPGTPLVETLEGKA